MHRTQVELVEARGAVKFLEEQAAAARETEGESSIVKMVVIDSLLEEARNELLIARLRELWRVS